jgi:hypothetical protein
MMVGIVCDKGTILSLNPILVIREQLNLKRLRRFIRIERIRPGSNSTRRNSKTSPTKSFPENKLTGSQSSCFKQRLFF